MNAVEDKFERMGARAKLVAPRPGWRQSEPPKDVIRLDVKKGVFEITASDNVEVQVLDVQPKDRHLLLMARIPDENPHRPNHKQKFLCGHDERDWFVAAVPEGSASTVTTAFEALKPAAVLDVQSTKKNEEKGQEEEAHGSLPSPRGMVLHRSTRFHAQQFRGAGFGSQERTPSPWGWKTAHCRILLPYWWRTSLCRSRAPQRHPCCRLRKVVG